ncbi:MAG: Lrp/AsnC family transcriptional regulator [Clostridiales bacterium]|nr:Lrp/AsnC family transcriptional regulator [Clostridiales bacterium]
MSDKQRQVLDLLNEDCRIPLERAALMLGMDIQEVAEIIDTLEKERVILCYRPVVNWDRTQRTVVEAMIEVKVTPQRDFGFDAVARRINSFAEVRSLYLMSGTYDLLIQVTAPTLKELAQFISERLSPLETVTGTSTSFVLKRYKQDGVVFDQPDEDRRLSISP